MNPHARSRTDEHNDDSDEGEDRTRPGGVPFDQLREVNHGKREGGKSDS